MRVKNFEVDLDSVEDCQKLINQLKSNIGELRILTHGSKKQRVRSVFEACQKIYNTDISDLYRHLDSNLESKLIDMFGLIASGGKLVNLDEGVNSKERRLKYKDELREISMLYKNSV